MCSRKFTGKHLQWSTCFASYTELINMFRYINPRYLKVCDYVYDIFQISTSFKFISSIQQSYYYQDLLCVN